MLLIKYYFPLKWYSLYSPSCSSFIAACGTPTGVAVPNLMDSNRNASVYLRCFLSSIPGKRLVPERRTGYVWCPRDYYGEAPSRPGFTYIHAGPSTFKGLLGNKGLRNSTACVICSPYVRSVWDQHLFFFCSRSRVFAIVMVLVHYPMHDFWQINAVIPILTKLIKWSTVYVSHERPINTVQKEFGVVFLKYMQVWSSLTHKIFNFFESLFLFLRKGYQMKNRPAQCESWGINTSWNKKNNNSLFAFILGHN